ncbi:MAG: hypothetical protein ACXVZX_16595 [Terriglobales bacterium]
MKQLLLAILLCAVFVCSTNAQDPARAVNNARMNDYSDHIRGKMVPMQEAQGIATPRGKMVNVREIALKTKEMNELIHQVSLDVINLDKGILSADLSPKLKKIEKLSKELRQSIE